MWFLDKNSIGLLTVKVDLDSGFPGGDPALNSIRLLTPGQVIQVLDIEFFTELPALMHLLLPI